MDNKERLILDKGYWNEYQERIAIMNIDGRVDELVAIERAKEEVINIINNRGGGALGPS